MTIYFVDTSALAKRYLIEVGSAWVGSWIEPSAGNTIVIFRLTPIEFLSVLQRRTREKTLNIADAARLEMIFCTTYGKNIFLFRLTLLCLISQNILSSVNRCVLWMPYNSRALNALQSSLHCP